GLFCNHVGGIPVGPVLVALATGALFVLAMRGLRASKGIGQVDHRYELGLGAIDPAGKSRRDLLQQPAIAVGVAECGERGITAARRIGAADRRRAWTDAMKHFAHRDAATRELGASC